MSSILLVSDSESEIENGRDLLTILGFEVNVAESSEGASIVCEMRRPYAVIADIEMDGGDGFEAIAAVRRTAASCFIIAATRGGHKDIWPKVGIACGADTYIVGPLTANKLENALPAGGRRATWH